MKIEESKALSLLNLAHKSVKKRLCAPKKKEVDLKILGISMLIGGGHWL